MPTSQRHKILEVIADSVEVPESAYEAAEARYKDVGKWLGRDQSASAQYGPHVFPQGSFRLGTVTRPLDKNAAHDLDLTCKLEAGITKETWTQEQLKRLVGGDVESYRIARGIIAPAEEKHRCWRLNYADELKFHLDIVPCIPETTAARIRIEEAMLEAGSNPMLAKQVAGLTISITDDRKPDYRQITAHWNRSNPEGYARWFESQMKLAATLIEKRLAQTRAARIEDMPAFRWKTPLQQSVQLLKRHRDIMFRLNPDAHPISIIITTLAARAYQGESDLGDAMEHILTNMGEFVRPTNPRVPNPVDPAEDFADKWSTREGRNKRLEDNFNAWLVQARADFASIMNSADADFISGQAVQKLRSDVSPMALRERLGFSKSGVAYAPAVHVIKDAPAKPWMK